MASRSLLGLFREVNPELLARKDRGKDASMSLKDGEVQVLRYGETRIFTGIQGTEFLVGNEASEAEDDGVEVEVDADGESVCSADQLVPIDSDAADILAEVVSDEEDVLIQLESGDEVQDGWIEASDDEDDNEQEEDGFIDMPDSQEGSYTGSVDAEGSDVEGTQFVNEEEESGKVTVEKKSRVPVEATRVSSFTSFCGSTVGFLLTFLLPRPIRFLLRKISSGFARPSSGRKQTRPRVTRSESEAPRTLKARAQMMKWTLTTWPTSAMPRARAETRTTLIRRPCLPAFEERQTTTLVWRQSWLAARVVISLEVARDRRRRRAEPVRPIARRPRTRLS